MRWEPQRSRTILNSPFRIHAFASISEECNVLCLTWGANLYSRNDSGPPVNDPLRPQFRNLTTAQLKDKYREVCGEESRSNHKQFLFRRIAWRVFPASHDESARDRYPFAAVAAAPPDEPKPVCHHTANGNNRTISDIHLGDACLQQGDGPQAAYAGTLASPLRARENYWSRAPELWQLQ